MEIKKYHVAIRGIISDEEKQRWIECGREMKEAGFVGRVVFIARPPLYWSRLFALASVLFLFPAIGVLFFSPIRIDFLTVFVWLSVANALLVAIYSNCQDGVLK